MAALGVGSHSARDVLSDGIMCWELLRRGGVMVFDDYAWDQAGSDSFRTSPARPTFNLLLLLLLLRAGFIENINHSTDVESPPPPRASV